MRPRRFCNTMRRHRLTSLCWVVVGVCLALGWSALVLGQEDRRQPKAVGPPSVSVQSIRRQIKVVSASDTLNKDTQTKATALYQQAIRELDRAETLAREAEEHTRLAAQLQDEIRRVEYERKTLPKEPSVAPAESAPLSTWEKLEKQKIEDFKKPREDLLALKQESGRRALRMKELPTELNNLRARQAKLAEQIATKPAADDAVKLAEWTFRVAEHRAVSEAIRAAEAERVAYEATTPTLLPLQRALAAERLALMEKELRIISGHVELLSRREVARQAERAEQALADAPQPVKPLARAALDWARQRSALQDAIERANEQLKQLRTTTPQEGPTLHQVREARRIAEEKLEILGLDNTVGQLLRRQRAELPDLPSLRRRSRERQSEMRQAQHQIFQLEERHAKLFDRHRLEQEAANYLAGLAPAERQGTPQERLTEIVREHLDAERDQLGLLIGDYQSHFYALIEIDAEERQIISETEDFIRFIDERVLWIRSAPDWSMADMGYAVEGARRLSDPQLWIDAGQTLINDAWASPLLDVGALLGFAVLFLYQRRMNIKVIELGQRAEQSTATQFYPTVLALGLTLLGSVAWPGALAFVGWRLNNAAGAPPSVRAVGAGLIVLGRVYLFLLLLRQTFRAKGLAGAHFAWTTTDLADVRRYLRLLMLLALPLTFVAAVLIAMDDVPRLRNSLGRACFILTLLIAAGMFHRVLRYPKGLLYGVSAAPSDGWMVRLRYVWYAAAVGSTLALALLAAMGYFYTAHQLVLRLELTAWLLFAAVVTGSVLLRWVLVNRRRLAMEEYRQRREAAMQEAAARAAEAEENESEAGDSQAAPESLVPQEPALDLTTINEQTRRLLLSIVVVCSVVGIWWVWVDVLPALGYLKQVRLWSVSMPVYETLADGTTRTVHDQLPVTLFDLALVVLLVVMTYVAARNIPGLLEMAVLRRLPLEPSVRFTIGAVCRYVIVFTGIVLFFNMLGIAWSKIQWLIAALTVGLGFGLQEIFANFVSGIIILFERPVRVGDFVTVGSHNPGWVTRIQMRAITLRDWYRRELIVPNKEFVTGPVVNWTLTDPISRLTFRFGVAYGTDTEKVREIMLKVAAEQSHVVAKPKPKAIFRRFGDNALEFELRAFLDNLDYWPVTVTGINTGLDKAFREAGIVIAFPQRDLHIKTIHSPLEIAAAHGAVGTDEVQPPGSPAESSQA